MAIKLKITSAVVALLVIAAIGFLVNSRRPHSVLNKKFTTNAIVVDAQAENAAYAYLQNRWSADGSQVQQCSTNDTHASKEWVENHWESCAMVHISCSVIIPNGHQSVVETSVCVQNRQGTWVALFSKPL
jgi:hypothetical protein